MNKQQELFLSLESAITDMLMAGEKVSPELFEQFVDLAIQMEKQKEIQSA